MEHLRALRDLYGSSSSILAVGHSLGGALATLFAADLGLNQEIRPVLSFRNFFFLFVKKKSAESTLNEKRIEEEEK